MYTRKLVESASLECYKTLRVSLKVMPHKRAETRLFWSVESSSSVYWTRYMIECIRLLEEVMRASATLPLSGTVEPTSNH